MSNKISGLVNKAILPIAVAGSLAGCTPVKDIKIAEYTLGDGESRIDIIKNQRDEFLHPTYYTINLYDSKGQLIMSAQDSHLGDNTFLVNDNGKIRAMTGLEIIEGKK